MNTHYQQFLEVFMKHLKMKLCRKTEYSYLISLLDFTNQAGHQQLLHLFSLKISIELF